LPLELPGRGMLHPATARLQQTLPSASVTE
jgi:hypothetical protein